MYDDSLSSAKRDKGVDGHRAIYTVQDISQAKYDFGDLLPEHVVTLIDQDYYLEDLTRFAGNPMVIKTLNTDALSGFGVDSVWYYQSPSVVVEVVNGGATYRQELHDYGVDLVAIPHAIGVFGANRPAFTIYNVHRYQIANTHNMVVFLAPSTTTYLPLRFYRACARYINGRDIEIPTLRRKANVESVKSNFLVGRFGQIDNPMYSIKRTRAVGPDSAVNMPEQIWHNLEFLQMQKGGVTTGFAADTIKACGHKVAPSGISMLSELLDARHVCSANIIYDLPLGEGQLPPFPNPATMIEPDGAPPITNVKPCLSVLDSGAELAYKEERLDPNKNKATPPEHHLRYAEEFVQFLVPDEDVGKLHIVDVEVVQTEQTRPAQVAKNRRTLRVQIPDVPKPPSVFLKTETQTKIRAPRAIINMDSTASMRTAQIGRTLSAYYKKHDHYVVGCSPREVADRIWHLCEQARLEGFGTAETDFSFFDECVSSWLRVNIFEAAAYRVVVQDQHALLKAWLAMDKDTEVKWCGEWIKLLAKTLSGSGTTTCINTLVDLYQEYSALREYGYGPDASWHNLGLCHGDDGICLVPVNEGQSLDEAIADYSAVRIRNAAHYGLTLKVENAGDYKSLKHFMGRDYCEPYFTYASYLTPDKLLVKLQAVSSSSKDALKHKVQGLYATEQNVPLISNYLEAIGRARGFNVAEFARLDPKNRNDKRVLDKLGATQGGELKNIWYNVRAGPIPCKDGDHDILKRHVSRALNLTVIELEKRMALLDKVQTIDDFEPLKNLIPLPEPKATGRGRRAN